MGGCGLIAATSLKNQGRGESYSTCGWVNIHRYHSSGQESGLGEMAPSRAYMSPRAEDLVLSREAMEFLGLVNDLDDSTAASVCHINLSAPCSGGSPSGGSLSDGGPGYPGSGD